MKKVKRTKFSEWIDKQIQIIEAQEDLIGRDEYVNHILKLINISSEKKSWTFAINGEWGSGKSFVINMINERLKGNDGKIVIKYNAWKNDFYEDPLIAILYNLLDSIELNSDLDLFLNPIKHGIGIISALLNFIPKSGELKKNTKNLIKAISKTETKNDKVKITNDFISYNDGLNVLKRVLTKLVENHKLVVLVDELDRCDPSYALSVLNRLHHLFDIPKVIVVIAVNKSNLINMIKVNYGEGNANYLDKFFDITLTLPSRGKKNMLECRTKEFLSSFNLEIDETNTQLYLSLIKTYSSLNARSLNKLFEHLKYIILNICSESISFSYIMLISYIWLKSIKEDRVSIPSRLTIQKSLKEYPNGLIASYDSTNNLFDGEYSRNLKSFMNKEIYINGLYKIELSSNESINNCIALLNLFIYRKDSDSFKLINQYYGTNFTIDDLEKVNLIYSLINILLER